MSWGGGWGNVTPQTARDVADAFYAGRSRKRGNCETDGEFYTLEGTALAWRIPDHQIASVTAARLLEGMARRPLLAFCVPGGWQTKMTARHLTALLERHGFDAECIGIKNPKFYIGGKPAVFGKWLTLDDIRRLPPEPPPAPKVPRAPGFVNLTAPLFPECVR